MIEARGARYPYTVVYTGATESQKPGRSDITLYHKYSFLVADSTDEAAGKAYRIAHILFPASLGWVYRDFTVVPLHDIAWISHPDLDQIPPVQPT